MTRSDREVVPTRRICAVLIALALSTAACDGGERPSDPGPGAQPTAQASSSCPNESEVIEAGKSEEDALRRADVDGDGADDDVYLNVDFEAPVGCQAFLVVETRDGQIVEPVWATGPAGGLPEPSLYAFSDLDGEGGYEIVVNEASGASTQFVAAYGWRKGELAPITVPDNSNGLFAFGGSVGHIEAVDCAKNGDLVLSSAVPAPAGEAASEDRYELRRTIYTLQAGELRKEETERHAIALADLDQFPEFRLGPFASCTAP